jgi:hypothetical protein
MLAAPLVTGQVKIQANRRMPRRRACGFLPLISESVAIRVCTVTRILAVLVSMSWSFSVTEYHVLLDTLMPPV